MSYNRDESCDSVSDINNLTWTAGDTEYIVLSISDEDDQIIEIESGKIQLRESITSSVVALEASGTYDAETGEFEIKFSSIETQSLLLETELKKTFNYDVELNLKNGDVYTPFSGKIKVIQSTTR